MIRKITVINGSPKGDKSITLYTVKYIEKLFPEYTFDTVHAGRDIRKFEKAPELIKDIFSGSDMILFAYPVYTFLVPSQLHRFIELMKECADLKGIYAAQVSTSMHFYDVTAHSFIRLNCDDMGLKYLGGLSAGMDDLLTEKGRDEAESFFKRLLWSAENDIYEPDRRTVTAGIDAGAHEHAVPEMKAEKNGRIAVVCDMAESGPLKEKVDAFCSMIPYKTDIVNIREYPFRGGCLGCLNCASDGKCVYTDGFDEYLRESIQTADAVVYAFTIKDHSMGYRFKLFDDRQFCNGHRTVTMGRPVGYIAEGDMKAEPDLGMVIEARAQVGGNWLAGISDSRGGCSIGDLAANLVYAVENGYQQPRDFWGVGGLKIFRDMIYQMRGLMKEDHKFYKKHGFYDFPQKKKGRIAGMYLVGAMLRNRKLKKKIGPKMTEGMIRPYEKVLSCIENKGKRH